MNVFKKMNESEKRIANITIITASVYTIISISIIKSIEYALATWSLEAKIILELCLGVISLIILFVGSEYFLSILMPLITKTKFENNEILGAWTIQISYTNAGTGDVITRIGGVKFENSVLGLTLKGDKLLDSKTDELVVDSWVSEKAELLDDRSGKTLFYSYKTRNPHHNNIIHKVGYVVAKCSNEGSENNIFRGDFVDLSVDNEEKPLLKGNVVLFKN